MRRIYLLFLLALALGLAIAPTFAACGAVDHASARAANALAVASNAALPLVVELYKAEQLEQLDAGGPDAGEIETRNRVIEVRHQWGPVWMAWEAYRVAFSIYADALDRGDSDGAADGLERMRLTACAFRHAVPHDLAPKLPALPVRCP